MAENKYNSWPEVVVEINGKEITSLKPLYIEDHGFNEPFVPTKSYTMHFKLTEEELAKLKETLGTTEALEVHKKPTKEQILKEALEEAVIQLEYLNGRWPTGTTPAVVARIKAAISAVERN